MPQRKRTSTGLLLLYLLALLQPPRADASLPAIGSCRPEACADSSAGVPSHAPALSTAGQFARLFSEPTRQTGDLSCRFTAGISDTWVETTAALRASGRAATCEHRDVLHLIRAADLGFRASAPRPPPPRLIT